MGSPRLASQGSVDAESMYRTIDAGPMSRQPSTYSRTGLPPLVWISTMLPLLIFSYVQGNLHLDRLGGPTVDEHRVGSAPPYGRQRGF